MSAVMKYWVLSVAVLLGASLVADCYGQPPGGGGGGRGGFGGGRGFGGMGRGVAGLLGMDEVKKELKVTDEQAAEVEKLREDSRAGVDWQSFGEMSDEERQKAMKSMQDASDKVDGELPTILDPDQFKRLLGLYAQRSGADALSNKLISKEIGLSDETVAKVKAKQDELNPMRRGRGQGGPGAGGGGNGPGAGGGGGEDFRERMAKAMKEREEALFGQITPEEKEKFEALKGAKFEFPERGGFGGGRGPGGQGGNGGGRGGRRGGNNDNN